MHLSAVVLPDLAPREFLQTAVEVERRGLRGMWTYDHLSWRDLRDGPWHAGVPLLAAAATATARVRLGFLVASPNFRHPVPFAKDVMTLDHLSGGRFDLGLGAGGVGADAHTLGLPPLSPAERHARFEAFVRLTRQLLAQASTTAAEGDYTAVDARMIPGPVQQPLPLTVAAAGPRGLALVAELAHGWVTYGPVGHATGEAWFTAVAAQSARLSEALASRGRAAAEVRRTCLMGLDDHWFGRDLLPRLQALGFDELAVHWPRADGRGLSAAELDGLIEAAAAG